MERSKKRWIRHGSAVLFCGLLSTPLFSQPEQTPAFPGAEGFGAWTKGGRGGNVILVTNLNDDGPGSLRAAMEAEGHRTVVFQVSGLIELKKTLKISEPFISIEGQTAPGDGICLKNHGCTIENTHDVILRFLRFRPGDQMKVVLDALSVYQSQNVIIDHCSTGWGTDETLSVTGGGTTNVTVQWCTITESLNNSVHHKGEHGYGSLLRVDGNLSFHHNLYADHTSRNPRPGCYGDTLRGGFLDFRNNAVYNWRDLPGYTAADKASINLVANYYKTGPSTKGLKDGVFRVGGRTTTLYAEHNVLEGRPEGNLDNWLLIHLPKDIGIMEIRIPVPLVFAPVVTETAEQALTSVLQNAGATLPKRDEVDNRVVNQFITNTGKIIDSQKDVGGWPAYRSVEAPKDSDRDGMPDAWEKAHGLNPDDPSDQSKIKDGTGYTNLEIYVNGLVRIPEKFTPSNKL